MTPAEQTGQSPLIVMMEEWKKKGAGRGYSIRIEPPPHQDTVVLALFSGRWKVSRMFFTDMLSSCYVDQMRVAFEKMRSDLEGLEL